MPLPVKHSPQRTPREITPSAGTTTAYTLHDLAKEWHFFNHGALFQYTGLDAMFDDPVTAWCQSFATLRPQPLLQPFQKTVIKGLTTLAPSGCAWSNIICGVPKDLWQSLWEFIGGVVVVDHNKRFFARVFSGDIIVPDPVGVDRDGFVNPAIPQIPLTVFCVETNTKRYEVRPGQQCAEFIETDTDTQTKAIMRRIFRGDLEAVDQLEQSAFQPLLDKYAALRGLPHAGSANPSQRSRGRLEISGR